MFRFFIFTVWLCMVGLSFGAEPRQKVFVDFEDDNALSVWRWRNDPSPDWDVTKTRFSVSGDWADHGRKSGKVEFGKAEPGEAPWRVINLRLRAVGANDWSSYDTVEMTIYNPTQLTWDHHSRIRFRSGVVGLGVEEIKPGVNRYIFEIDKIRKMINIKNMPEFQIAWLGPETDMVFYIDNIRLMDYTEIRREALAKRLKKAAQILPVKDLSERTRKVDREGLKQIGEDAQKAVFEFISSLGRPLSASETEVLIPLLSPLPMQHLESVDGDDPSKALAMNNTVLGRARLDDMCAAVAARNALRRRIEKLNSKQSFVIGRCDWPRTWFIDEVFPGRLDGELAIAGAGDETVPFQIMILARKDLKNVRVSVTDISGPGKIAAEAFEIAPMGWRTDKDTGRLLSDMLRPDIREFPIRNGVAQPVWINLNIPPDTPAGLYQATVRVDADGETCDVPLKLNVYNFTLPRRSALKTGANGAVMRPDSDYEFLARHRFNPGNIYRGAPPPLAEMKQAGALGVSFFNLCRFSDKGKGAFANEKYSGARFKRYTKVIDNWLRENVKSDDDWKFILENCFVYTFDEPAPNRKPALDELCGKIKKRYRNIKTAAAINMNMDPDFENLDILMCTPSYLKKYRERLPQLKQKGREIWWYNIFRSNTNETLIRAQFWATFLNPYIEGVLYYAVHDRSGTVYGPDLFHPAILDAPIRPDQYGIIRRNSENRPLSTLTMEYWREGIQDYEYLTMLRRKTDALAASGKNPELVREARDFLKLKGLAVDILDTEPVQEAEITVAMSGLSTSMDDYIRAKQKAASLIEAIDAALK